MSEACCTADCLVMILACSGGSNVGQLTNQVAVELTREGFGRMYCLAGVGGKLSAFVQSAKDAPGMLVLDGCPVGCAKAIFRETGLALRNYLVITELGLEKNQDLTPKRSEADRIKAYIKRVFAGQPLPMAAAEAKSCDCCG